MKTASRISLFLLLAAASPNWTHADETADALRAIEARYRDSLVRVRFRQEVSRSTAEPPVVDELTTTGVVVTFDGRILTSAVVFEPFDQVPHGLGIRFPASVSRQDAAITEARVELMDGRELPAELLGRDPDAGVAFFQIQDFDGELSPVRFEATGTPQVGDEVVVASLMPEPLGPALAVELSRVQAVSGGQRPGFLVSTGATDPVGSLVLRLDGSLIGMLDAVTVSAPNTRTQNPLAFIALMRDLPKSVGRGFARPAGELAAAEVKVEPAEPVRRAWLGVEMQALSEKLAEHMELPVRSGILVGYVYRESPAERAGIEQGDILTELGGVPIGVTRDEDLGVFAERILRAGVGADLALGYLRDGESASAVATLAPAPRSAREAETEEIDELDLTVRELTYDYLATRFLEPDARGVVVVDPPVAVSGNTNRVLPGDLLVRLDDRPVDDLAGLRAVMEDVRNERPTEVVLFVERGRESFFFAVKPDWR